MTASRPASPFVPLALAVVCISTGSIFVRMASAPPLAVAFYRIFIASLLLVPFAAGSARRSWPTLPPRAGALLVASGVALGVHFATWITSLSFTSVAASVLLVNTAPLFTLAFSRAFLGEGVPAVVIGAMALALAGAALIAVGDWAEGANSLTGDLLALAGAVTLSLYHVIGRGLRAALPLDAYVLGVWATAAATLAALSLAARVSLAGHPPRTYAFLLALAVVPTLGGHGLVNLSLRRLPAPTVGLFLLGEPVGATVLAFFFFHETPGTWTLAGGAIVLASLALLTRAART
ncbi:MAG: EamA family transporter [Acidobacteria bacterium]|nr:MAG: EamA family transporter [Acidobacteriota bacterium]